jgi:hypothetical protein
MFINQFLIVTAKDHYISTGYYYGVISYKTFHALRPVSDLLCIPISVLIIPDTPTRALCQVPAETSSSESGEMAVNFISKLLILCYVGFSYIQ